MDWLQIIVLLFGNVAWVLPLWMWSRSESNADRREIREDWKHLDSKIDLIRQDTKDFHARLCILEERYLQILTTTRIPINIPHRQEKNSPTTE